MKELATVMRERSKFGIYFSDKENQVVRINSPYWIPDAPDWIFLTDEVNCTLLQIRDLIKDKKLSSVSELVVWGSIPLQG